MIRGGLQSVPAPDPINKLPWNKIEMCCQLTQTSSGSPYTMWEIEVDGPTAYETNRP